MAECRNNMMAEPKGWCFGILRAGKEILMRNEMPLDLQGATQRTRLSLSVTADEVINEDLQNFMLETNRTGFLNRLFLTLFHHSEACIDEEIDRKKRYFLSVLEANRKTSRLQDETQMESVANILAESYRHDLVEKYTTELKKKPKAAEFNIRLNKDVFIMLYSGEVDWENHKAYRTIRRYLEALLESYAEKSVCERELLFFADNVLQIRQALEAKPKKRSGMIITLRSASGAAPVENTEKQAGRVKADERKTGSLKEFIVIPYCLETDKGNNYYYLAGLSRPFGKRDMKMIPVSFRLSRIESVRWTDLEQGLSDADAEELQNRIDERGIQYIFAEENKSRENIVVNLTAEGMRKYRRILHNRPMFSTAKEEEDGNIRMTFGCSYEQAMYYFIQFGQDAVIVSPNILRTRIKDTYDLAAEAYKTEDKEECR